MSSVKGDRSKRDGAAKPRRRRRVRPLVVTGVCDDEVEVTVPASVSQLEVCSSSSEQEDADLGKRYKPGSPEFLKAVADAAAAAKAAEVAEVGSVVDSPAVVSSAVGSATEVEEVSEGAVRQGKGAGSAVGAIGWVRRMQEVTCSLMDVAFGELGPDLPRKVLEHGSRYQGLLMDLIGENERLKGRLEILEADRVGGGTGGALGVAQVQPVPEAPIVAAPVAAPLPVAPLAKPVQTWSVVVKGKEGATSKEVVRKVVKEVGPTLGVRVHGIRPMRDGGAVIRTPSVVEREKIAANGKFAEVGLEVAVNDKLGPRVVVQRVHSEISPDEFMDSLYEMNLSGMLSRESYLRSVRLVSSPWKSDPDGQVNVVLECTERVMEKLVAEGAYVKWFRFAARLQDAVPACYRCLGFDHRVRECRLEQSVCRRCGLTGHVASRCPNPAHCRNCGLKGYRADHMMVSPACPVYAALTARANARH